MEQIDLIQARQVWNRVRGGQTREEPLQALTALELETELFYSQLARLPMLSGTRLMARLRQENRSFLRILAGIGALTDLPRQAMPRHSLRGTPEGMAQQCWELRKKALALLEEAQLPGLPQAVTEQLRDRYESHSLAVLELLGVLQGR